MSEQKPEIQEMTFEEALRELEALVRRLEEGKMPLEDAIKAYETGDRLRARCESLLKEAQLKVEQVVTGPEGTVAGTKTTPLDQD
ncbi:MAG: exodeoxyribonuclease VII small subunit [Holosporales bacterium]